MPQAIPIIATIGADYIGVGALGTMAAAAAGGVIENAITGQSLGKNVGWDALGGLTGGILGGLGEGASALEIAGATEGAFQGYGQGGIPGAVMGGLSGFGIGMGAGGLGDLMGGSSASAASASPYSLTDSSSSMGLNPSLASGQGLSVGADTASQYSGLSAPSSLGGSTPTDMYSLGGVSSQAAITNSSPYAMDSGTVMASPMQTGTYVPVPTEVAGVGPNGLQGYTVGGTPTDAIAASDQAFNTGLGTGGGNTSILSKLLGGNMSNGAGNMGLLSALQGLQSIYGMYSANQMQSQMSAFANQLDPALKDTGMYNNMLKELMGNPGAYLQGQPGYQAGLNAVQRSLGSQGYQGSGNMMAGLQQYGQAAYNSAYQQLAQLAGVGNAGAAANMMANGATAQAQISGGAVDSAMLALGMGLGKWN